MTVLLPSTNSLQSSPVSKTFASVAADADAIKTLVATSLSVQNYSGGALNGVLGAGSVAPAGHNITVTTTVDAATFNTTDAIVITGLDYSGSTITDNLQLTAAGGGETITGTKFFASVTNIMVPAQLTTNGEFTFGIVNVGLPQCRQIRIGVAGDLKVLYTDGVTTDTIPSLIAGEKLDIIVSKIFTSGTTATNLTILF